MNNIRYWKTSIVVIVVVIAVIIGGLSVNYPTLIVNAADSCSYSEAIRIAQTRARNAKLRMDEAATFPSNFPSSTERSRYYDQNAAIYYTAQKEIERLGNEQSSCKSIADSAAAAVSSGSTSRRNYSSSSSSSGSSSAKQDAVATAKARCLASETKPGRLRILFATDENAKPVSASMWLSSLSADGSDVKSDDIVQLTRISTYGSLTQSAEEIGIDEGFSNVYFAETGMIPPGDYTVKAIVKDLSGASDATGGLKEITQEFKVESCVHSTMVFEILSTSLEEEKGIEDEKFCFSLSDGTQFYGTQTEYASFIADSDGSIGIDSMVIGPCEGEAQTASEESSGSETGGVSTTDNQSSSAVTGVGVGVDSGDDDGISILFGGGFDASSLGDSSAALETALEDSKSLDSGAQKLLESADKGKAEKDQLKRAGKAIESGDTDNEDVLALEERKYTPEQIVAAYNAYQAIKGALAKLDEDNLLALAKDSIIASGVVEEVLGDEVAEALEQGAQLASDALSEVSGITERTGVAVDIAESWVGSIGAAINSTLSGILGGLF